MLKKILTTSSVSLEKARHSHMRMASLRTPIQYASPNTHNSSHQRTHENAPKMTNKNKKQTQNQEFSDSSTLHRDRLEVLYEVMSIVTNDTLDLQIALSEVAERLITVPTARGHRPVFVDIALLNERNQLLLWACSGSAESKLSFQEKVSVIDIPYYLEHHKPIGMSGRAAYEGKSQLAPTTDMHPDYIHCNPSTKSALAVPFCLNQTSTSGALNLEFNVVNAFTEDDVVYFERIAQFVAVELRKRQQRDAVYEITKTIFAGMERDQETWLNGVLQQVIGKLRFSKGRDTFSGAVIQRYDSERNVLQMEAAYPNDTRWQSYDVAPNNGESSDARIGISGRAVKSKQAQYDPDVRSETYYVPIREGVLSQVAVPIIQHNCVWGVLTVKSGDVNGFDKHDVNMLKRVAEMFVIALENRRLKSIANTQLSLVNVGLQHNFWQHEAGTLALIIRNEIEFCRMALDSQTAAWTSTDSQRADQTDAAKIVFSAFDNIYRLVQRIIHMPMMPSLYSNEESSAVNFLSLVRERVQTLENVMNPPIHSTLAVEAKENSLEVRVSPRWARYALDMLFDTLVKTSKTDKPGLHINVRLHKQRVEVEIHVTGTVSPSIVAMLRKHLPDSKTISDDQGSRLLVSQVIFEAFDGSLEVRDSTAHGTVLMCSLPRWTTVPKLAAHIQSTHK